MVTKKTREIKIEKNHYHKNLQEPVFSLENLGRFSQGITTWETIAFLGHWQRIFGTWYPTMKHWMKLRIVTIKNKKIRNQHAHFWCMLLQEVLAANHYSLIILCQDTHQEKSFWQMCLSMHHEFTMPLAIGKQLLWLHYYLRPDLQGWKKY
ncbi:MAG: hypothetical protein A3F67_07040 [Verrucomicrobia bacterium RIFCSPHIGHO2_12_FULL_41_10]|nr:MAG: hypothetical protein A3F67_07040 [Verrucomicrobia bacterium RIFCSPHIGHO2_12_FULL_41_10]